MEFLRSETNEALLYKLIRLEIEKRDDFRNDAYYQEQIDSIRAEILRRMESR